MKVDFQIEFFEHDENEFAGVRDEIEFAGVRTVENLSAFNNRSVLKSFEFSRKVIFEYSVE